MAFKTFQNMQYDAETRFACIYLTRGIVSMGSVGSAESKDFEKYEVDPMNFEGQMSPYTYIAQNALQREWGNFPFAN